MKPPVINPSEHDLPVWSYIKELLPGSTKE